MESSSKQHANSGGNFVEAVLKARVAQICESVGYHAITQDSSNILIDIYRRTFQHLARHCKDAANNNRRIEASYVDLKQAYDFVGISIPELQEYVETVKIPFDFPIPKDEDESEQKPANRIQRNLLVDDLLEAEKNNQLEDQADDGENKAMSENGADGDDDKPTVPLLKDTYEEIANKFTDITPVVADKKIRLGGRILLLANTKLKISTPILPEPVPSTSGVDIKLPKERKKKKRGPEKKQQIKESLTTQSPTKPLKQGKGKKKKKLSREFVPLEHDTDKEPEKEKIKVRIKEEKKEKIKEETNKQKGRIGKRPYNKKPKVAIKPLDIDVAEPPSFFPMEEDAQQTPISIKQEKLTPSPKLPKETKTGKRKDRSSDEFKTTEPVSTSSINSEVKETKTKSGRGRKKTKTTVITPLDPSIAEPPSFFPILENKIEDLPNDVLDTALTPRLPTPTVATKQTKSGKKKKKSNNQFAIVTETVTDADKEEKEWFCPACGNPDDGDWVQCDSCEEWYHFVCTGLKKAPEDDERWECIKCTNKSKPQKKAHVQVETLKLKTPEPVITKTPPPPPPTVAPSTTAATAPVNSNNQDDLCPECNLPDDGTMMIQCDDPFCAKWFHGKCVNLLEEPKEDESWFCKVCVDKQQSAFKRRRRAK